MSLPTVHLATRGICFASLLFAACSSGGFTAASAATIVRSTAVRVAAPRIVNSLAAPAAASRAQNVLIVANRNVPASMSLASIYMGVRGIPRTNLLTIPLSSDLRQIAISQADVQTQIFNPVAAAIKKLASAGTRVDFVVMMYGMPYAINTGPLYGYSVDGLLSQATGAFPTHFEIGNPYLHATRTFDSSTYHMVLVTRLDGRSPEDVISMIRQSVLSDHTRPNGEFFFDYDPNREIPGYSSFNGLMVTAQANLAKSGFNSQIDMTTTFVNPTPHLSGYTSWGSNDAHFRIGAYDALRFVPGALAETAVSTSASNIRLPGGRQSQIANLVHQGVTGVMGDVSEPQLFGIPDPTYVYSAYAQGHSLAESFYIGLQVIVWKEIILGDPLCAPYAS